MLGLHLDSLKGKDPDTRTWGQVVGLVGDPKKLLWLNMDVEKEPQVVIFKDGHPFIYRISQVLLQYADTSSTRGGVCAPTP